MESKNHNNVVPPPETDSDMTLLCHHTINYQVERHFRFYVIRITFVGPYKVVLWKHPNLHLHTSNRRLMDCDDDAAHHFVNVYMHMHII
jgi:hypothetical protein